jgi:hypothetical protein
MILPLWAHGFFVRSLDYNDPDRISASVDKFI